MTMNREEAAQIVVLKLGAISRADKQKLSRRGFVVIEMADPTALRLIQVEPAMPGASALARIAVETIAEHNCSSASVAFTEKFAALLAALSDAAREEIK